MNTSSRELISVGTSFLVNTDDAHVHAYWKAFSKTPDQPHAENFLEELKNAIKGKSVYQAWELFTSEDFSKDFPELHKHISPEQRSFMETYEIFCDELKKKSHESQVDVELLNLIQTSRTRLVLLSSAPDVAYNSHPSLNTGVIDWMESSFFSPGAIPEQQNGALMSTRDMVKIHRRVMEANVVGIVFSHDRHRDIAELFRENYPDLVIAGDEVRNKVIILLNK